ncbi:PTS transporter subunit EIIC [Faecalibaculum rodentium]|jgi:PTS system lactose-specific IIC component|uniref:PTS system lactose-specific EIICB component n=1 Tax=Faecalibaculum rodentium TaxID=1702221 RepID=A0A140DS22_9FIRM|nr:PTS transporter subunit EIIC [Faecalibaculum rodentium]AMK53449.1 PTS system, lactose-specific IIC component [Faecalibaculum rodentium]
MNAIIGFIEKGKPFFNKLAGNAYLQAIRDGFLAAMPAILFSSIFILCAALPEVFGVTLPAELSSWLWRVYNLSMGIVGILVAATTARALGESFSRKLPKGMTMNVVSVMLASISGYLMLAVTEIDGGIDVTYLGTKGLLCSFIAAFITANMYKFCTLKNITIKMPPEVPGVISNVFKNVFPFSFSVLCCVAIDFISTQFFGVRFAESLITLFSPLFSAADSYFGLGLIAGAMAFFWFLGIHGPSIVEPAVAAAIYANVEANLMLVQNGEQASHALTVGFNNFIACLGGTGCTLVVPFLFMWLCKSKQLKAVGKASFIPVIFNVNEPVLFAAPIVLNPYFFVPFLLAPIANAVLFKFFIDVLSMNSFIYVLPWATPAPVGLFLGTGMAPMALLCSVVLIAVDALIYIPFVKAYDSTLVQEEAEKAVQGDVDGGQTADTEPAAIMVPEKAEPAEAATAPAEETKPLSVLVLCVGAGTSAMFANAVNKGAEEKHLPVTARAEAFGAHTDILDEFQLVVLSPQVQSRYDEIKADADRYGIKVVKTKGAQYIGLTKDPEGAVDFVVSESKE